VNAQNPESRPLNYGLFLLWFGLLWIAFGCSKSATETGHEPSRMASISNGEATYPSRALVTQPRLITNSSSGRTSGPLSKDSDSADELPKDALTGIQKYLNQKPSPHWLVQLKPEDQKVFLPRYENQQLTNKLALTIALAWIGDENVVSAFKKTLLERKPDRPLSLEERNVMLFTIEGMGLLARRSDSAWEFLNQAIDPRFWKSNASFDLGGGSDQYRWLAVRAISSLGYSGRPEVEVLFQRLKENPFISDGQGGGWLLDSALIDGIFFNELIQNRGIDYLKRIYGTEESVREFQAWKESETGKNWIGWLKQWRKEHPKEASN
jgi:hypothetical protein